MRFCWFEFPLPVGSAPLPSRTILRVVLAATLTLPALPGAPASAQTSADSAPVVTANIGHPFMRSIAFGPNARWMASGGADNTVKLWDVATGRLLRTLAGHTTFLYGVAASPDGTRIASVDADRVIKIWDPATGKTLRTIKSDGIGRLEFSRDGRSLYAEGLTVLRRFDVASGAIAQTYTPAKLPNFQSYLPNALAVSADERLIATARICNPTYNDRQCFISVWDARSGRLLRTWQADDQVTALALSPDGRWLASGGAGSKVDLWEASTSRLVRRFETGEKQTNALTFSPDSNVLFAGADQVHAFEIGTGRLIWSAKPEHSNVNAMVYEPTLHLLVSAGGYVSLWEPATGRLVRTLKGPATTTTNASVMLMPDGRWLVSATPGITIWDPASGQLETTAGPELGRIVSLTAAVDGRLLVPATKGKSVRLWDVASGRLFKELAVIDADDKTHVLLDAALSADGRFVATATLYDNTIKIWDVATGALVRSFAAYEKYAKAVAFAPDGRTLVSQGWEGNKNGPTKFWNPATGALLRSLNNGDYDDVDTVAFSADGKVLYSSDSTISHESFRLRDPQSGRPLRSFKHGFNIDGYTVSPDGRYFATTGGLVNETKLWDAASGRMLFGWTNKFGSARSVAFSRDSRQVIVVTTNAAMAVWSTQTGELLTTTIQSTSGEWVTITPEGFFVASANGAALLHVVQGFDTTGIDQVYQALYRPDLVREKRAGDPRGLVREAAARLDLDKVLASGQAPAVRMASPGDGSTAPDNRITAEVEVTDRGGGTGRVEWRINGLTVGVDNPAASAAGQPLRLTRSLALAAGSNAIEVVAYNGANLIASLPARVTVTAPPAAPGAPTAGSARLFVLAAGTDNYADERFRLTYSVADATAMAEALRDAGKGLYRSIEVKMLSDAEVTRAKLDAAFAELAATVQPDDVFVVYLAGHGKTVDGRYYLVPQTFKIDGAVSNASIDQAVARQGIAQVDWQRWFAQVPARRSLILFDTCESGTIAKDESETKTLERGAANDRLARATGRSIITASSGSTEAFEGYHGHGLFTYNLLDALDRGDGDRNGTIEVAELAAYVYAQVTAISERVFKQRQEPQMSITLNYALTRQARVLRDDMPAVATGGTPTFQLTQAAALQIRPANGATVVRSLSAKTAVTVLRSEGGWSLIASEGKPLGYVATRDLAPMQ